jgi:Zn-dependent peptidase ImmA (M78 family)
VKRSQPARKGESAGIEARGALGLGETQPLDDILRSLERTTQLQIFVRPLGEDGIAGAHWASQGVPFIIVNGDQPVQRQRFTLAHEFGHHWLRHGNQIDERVVWGDDSAIEVEANAFAAAFLMPPPAITKALEGIGRPPISFDVLITLASLFGVSAKAMRVRLDTLGALRPQRAAEFDALIEAKQHHGRAARIGIPPVIDSLVVAKQERGHLPPLMERKVIVALEHDLLPREVAAKILRTDESGLDAICDRLAVTPE